MFRSSWHLPPCRYDVWLLLCPTVALTTYFSRRRCDKEADSVGTAMYNASASDAFCDATSSLTDPSARIQTSTSRLPLQPPSSPHFYRSSMKTSLGDVICTSVLDEAQYILAAPDYHPREFRQLPQVTVRSSVLGPLCRRPGAYSYQGNTQSVDLEIKAAARAARAARAVLSSPAASTPTRTTAAASYHSPLLYVGSTTG